MFGFHLDGVDYAKDVDLERCNSEFRKIKNKIRK